MKGTLTEKFWAKVDRSSEGCWEWQGSKDERGYGRMYRDGKLHFVHRFSVELATGQKPTQPVDHICHNPSCVNPAHLREVTVKQNMENRGELQSRNASGFRGVSWHKAHKKWQATVTHKGKKIALGLFVDPAEAGEVARLKRLELFTHNDRDRQQQQAS